MLIKRNRQDRNKSQYICDSCEKEMSVDDRIVIFREIAYKKKKKYDLCKDCWRKVRIIVEKHKLKKEV